MFTVKTWRHVESRGSVARAESDWFSVERYSNCSEGPWSFRIRNRYASLRDFGDFERDIDFDECACRGIRSWTPEKDPDRARRTMEDFGLTRGEWDEIQNALAQVMPFRCEGCPWEAEPAIQALRRRAAEAKRPE